MHWTDLAILSSYELKWQQRSVMTNRHKIKIHTQQSAFIIYVIIKIIIIIDDIHSR